MLKIRTVGGLLAIAVVLGLSQPAQAQQTVNFTLGGFMPRNLDARVDDDVLAADTSFLSFRFRDFTGPSVGGEWLIPIGNFFEAGAGISFYSSTVPSVYTDFVDDSGNDIQQKLRLREVPVSFTFRLLPLGQSSGFQPYIGGGLGVFAWRYTEFGDFVDFSQAGQPVSNGTFVASGTEVGPVVLGGVRFASDVLTVGGEIRYQSASAALSSDFAGSKIDLGGWTYQFTVGKRFGRK